MDGIREITTNNIENSAKTYEEPISIEGATPQIIETTDIVIKSVAVELEPCANQDISIEIDLNTQNDKDAEIICNVSEQSFQIPSNPNENENTTVKCADTDLYLMQDFPFIGKVQECGQSIWNPQEQYYTNRCLWSPDGLCLLTVVHEDGIHLFELNPYFYNRSDIPSDKLIEPMTSVIHLQESSAVYDYCWYPLMDSQQYDTCFWITTKKNSPIQMFDAITGDIRCSYRTYDQYDELEAALSTCFSTSGSRIFGGFKKKLVEFDTAVPGKKSITYKVKDSISCLATDLQDLNLLATGSWEKHIHLHDARSIGQHPIKAAKAHKGGVTRLKFSPCGRFLFSGARKDNSLFCWDVRNMNEPWLKMHRSSNTNQVIDFDISVYGQWLVSGGVNGCINIFDLKTEVNGNAAAHQIKLSNDSVNGVSLHNRLPIFATSTGQHRNTDEDLQNEQNDNSITYWWYGTTDRTILC